jgi:hypothetical protein
MEKRAFKVLASQYGGDYFLRRIGSRSYLEVKQRTQYSKIKKASPGFSHARRTIEKGVTGAAVNPLF